MNTALNKALAAAYIDYFYGSHSGLSDPKEQTIHEME